MAGYIVYLASLGVFTFGALTFSVLAVSYWRDRQPRHGRVFPAFTLLCAIAFVSNLLVSFIPGIDILRDLATGVLPAVLLHLVSNRRSLTRAFYSICAVLAVLHAFLASSLLDAAPAAMFALAGLIGVWIGESLWSRILLGMMFVSAAAALAFPEPMLASLPDYLLLAFFCVHLYYKERLIFFDLLIKRGAYFLLAVAALTAFFAFLPQQPGPRQAPWIVALLLSPLWLIAPWLDRRLGDWIDRLWLRRKYSIPDAERLFLNAVQQAANEQDLRARAEGALSDIFQTTAEVRFAAGASIDLRPRSNSIPFMSDDHRLLQSLTRTLSVVLENVRFRDREQELRLLASRAELKALRAQINPHFLFNALNAIAGLIHHQPALADETVEHLAEVFRYTLRKSETEWVRLEEEIEFVDAYLRVEQARFGNRLTVAIDIDPAAAAIPVPAMTIQPLIENAVKHGASNVEGCAAVTLRVSLENDKLSIVVSDNGPGFPPGFTINHSGGHGLRNVAERIKGYYGDDARLQWTRNAGATQVALQIPRRTRVASNDRR
jgi:signal transduction histidine kinase